MLRADILWVSFPLQEKPHGSLPNPQTRRSLRRRLQAVRQRRHYRRQSVVRSKCSVASFYHGDATPNRFNRRTLGGEFIPVRSDARRWRQTVPKPARCDEFKLNLPAAIVRFGPDAGQAFAQRDRAMFRLPTLGEHHDCKFRSRTNRIFRYTQPTDMREKSFMAFRNRDAVLRADLSQGNLFVFFIASVTCQDILMWSRRLIPLSKRTPKAERLKKLNPEHRRQLRDWIR